MTILSKTLSVLALALLSQLALAMPEPQVTAPPELILPSCYTYTVTTPYTKRLPWCPLIKCVAPLDCITTQETTVTVPCKNPRFCPKTPTATVTGKPACPTCHVGCTTSIVTATLTTGCTQYTNPVEPPY